MSKVRLKEITLLEFVETAEKYLILIIILGSLQCVIFLQYNLLLYVYKYLIAVTSSLAGLISIHLILKNQERLTKYAYDFIADNPTKINPKKINFDKNYCSYYHPNVNVLCIREVDATIEKFFAAIINSYILSWYSKISDDKAFLSEIVNSIKLASSILIKRFQQVCQNKMFQEKFYKVVISHLDMYQINRQEILANIKGAELEKSIIERNITHLHVIMKSRSNEINYLSHLAAELMPHIFSQNPLKSTTIHQLLQDVLAYRVLLPTLDIVSDPDFFNHFVIILLDGKLSYYPDVDHEPRVILLQHMCANYPIQKPVIDVTLKEIVQNQDLLFIFMNFMKSEGVLNLIQFYMSLEDFMKLILNPDLKVQQIDILYRQCQQMYKNFFDQTSPDRIDFDDLTIEQMKLVSEDKPENVLKLRNTSPLYTSREHVVRLLEQLFIPLFCQSGPFLNWVLGGKGVSVGGKINTRTSKKGAEMLVAVSKLGTKLIGVFRNPLSESLTMPDGNGPGAADSVSFADSSIEDEIGSVTSDFVKELTRVSQVDGPSGLDSVDSSNLNLSDTYLDGSETSLFLLSSPYRILKTRDLSRLTINIPRIESRCDAYGRQNIYFIIQALRPATQNKFSKSTNIADAIKNSSDLDITLTNESNMLLPEDIQSSSLSSCDIDNNNNNHKNNLNNTNEWIVERRYLEFYVLESKLSEFHGIFEDVQLPVKRAFSAKDWDYLSAKRGAFETFLQKLCAKPELKNSELLYTFLTSPDDFYSFCTEIDGGNSAITGNFLLPDINIGKMLKAPLRLIPEKGQHLEPFLQAFIHSTEIMGRPKKSHKRVGSYSTTSSHKFASGSKKMSPDSISLTSATACGNGNSAFFGNLNHPTASNMLPFENRARNFDPHITNSWLENPMFKRDFKDSPQITTSSRTPHTKRRKQYAISGFYDYLIYFCFNIYHAPEWLIKFLLAFRVGVKPLFEMFVSKKIAEKAKILTHPIFLNDMIKLIHKSIFPVQSKSQHQINEKSHASKTERAKNAHRLVRSKSYHILRWCLPEANIIAGTELLFDCFQHPLLNKHLTYVLLDTLVSELFPELGKPPKPSI